MKTAPATEPTEPVVFIIPEGIEIQAGTGAITGRPQFRVANYEMPWSSTPEIAVGVYERLRKAYESGYFATSGIRRKEA